MLVVATAVVIVVATAVVFVVATVVFVILATVDGIVVSGSAEELLKHIKSVLSLSSIISLPVKLFALSKLFGLYSTLFKLRVSGEFPSLKPFLVTF